MEKPVVGVVCHECVPEISNVTPLVDSTYPLRQLEHFEKETEQIINGIKYPNQSFVFQASLRFWGILSRIKFWYFDSYNISSYILINVIKIYFIYLTNMHAWANDC